MADKPPHAFRTISEVAVELGVPQHRLRYWESRFPQLRPLTRAGQRRYYRPEDVALVRRIHDLLSAQGYTIGGVQKLLAAEQGKRGATAPAAPSPADPVAAMRAVRAIFAKALATDSRA